MRGYLSNVAPTEFSWSDKFEMLFGIVDVLVYIHSMAIIHRDVKSRNIVLDSVKGAKLADFGIAGVDTEETMTVGVGTYR